MIDVTEHDLRCPELTDPQLEPNPQRCTCRDESGHAPAESWANGPLCAFDLETTGKDPLEAHVVTATVIQLQTRPRGKTLTRNWLADPGVEIPDEAAAIHGITTEHARQHGRPLAEVVDQVCGSLQLAWSTGIPVVGHNVSYDLTVLAAECSRLDLRPFTVDGPVVDTIVLDRGVDRYRRGSRKLIDTAAHYGVRLTEEEAHGSEADALAAARVAFKIARRFPVVGQMPLAALQRWQADRHRAWANGFGAYLRNQGKKDDVCRDWPLRSST